jgi:hypothetical protein
MASFRGSLVCFARRLLLGRYLLTNIKFTQVRCWPHTMYSALFCVYCGVGVWSPFNVDRSESSCRYFLIHSWSICMTQNTLMKPNCWVLHPVARVSTNTLIKTTIRNKCFSCSILLCTTYNMFRPRSVTIFR